MRVSSFLRMFCCTAVALVLASGSASAVEYGANLIPAAAANFEDVSNWIVHSWAYISDPPEPTNSGDHAHVFQDTAARTGYPTSWYPITTVGNRAHFLSAYVREPNGALALRRLRLGTGLFINISAGGTHAFVLRGGQLHLDGSGVVQVNFGIYVQMASWTADRKCIFDDVSVQRERVIPDPNHDSAGGMLARETQTVSIYNVGGASGGHNVFFDPDITVTSADADIHSVAWVSDTQVDVSLTPLKYGGIRLTLTNVYSDLSTDHVMSVSGPFTLDSDDFPLIIMDVGYSAGAMDRVNSVMHQSYLHRYALGVRSDMTLVQSINEALDYLDLAYENGLLVMMNLRARDIINRANPEADLQTFAEAIKDHPALGFWYLADEPELWSTPSEIESLYNVLKAVDPSIPVGNAHCQCTGWHLFGDAQDISMPDNYPVYNQPFPEAPINNTTNWNHTNLQTYGTIIPIMQLFNWDVFGQSGNRYPVAEEIRYWSYASLCQGARGLAWFSYGRSFMNFGPSWMETQFAGVMEEVKAFTQMVSPAHTGQTLLNGQAGADHMFMAYWPDRTDGDWLVVVNGQGTARQVTLNAGAVVEDQVLRPWGLATSGAAPVYMAGGQFSLALDPWEVKIFQVGARGDITGDGAVDMLDLGVLASQWTECTDPAHPDCID